MTTTLLKDTIQIEINSSIHRDATMHVMSRWAYVPVNQKLISDENYQRAQEYQIHGTAICVNSNNNQLILRGEYVKNRPIVAVRTYVSAETAVINHLYFMRCGTHRCNIAIDEKMGAGVYAYTDVTALLNSLNRLLSPTRHIVIGVISGYLMKVGTSKTKICLDPRSCKLLVFYTNKDTSECTI